jgi:hypothetical protein
MLKTFLHRASDAKPLSLFAATAGTLGFVLSLLLACSVLLAQGNPVFLLIWLAAVAATTALARVHMKWQGTFERIYAMNMRMPHQFRQARPNWNLDVEDVVFREIPN